MPPERAVRIVHLVPTPKDRECKFGEFTSVNSILHSSNGATAYISRYIEPAYFAVGTSIGRSSAYPQRFAPRAHFAVAAAIQGPLGVIAYWATSR